MGFIRNYLKPYPLMLLGVLMLASINQIFSLLDPQVFRRLIDNYLTQPDQRTTTEYMYGVFWGLGGLIGVAMISRIAKNFQDYFVNVMVQRVGTNIYQDTINHIFSLPYSAFEDQQSGQVMQKLIKAKQAIQDFITQLINIIFFSIVGISFVLIYSFYVDRRVGAMYCLLLPLMVITSMTLSKKIKIAQEVISKESNTIAGSVTESLRNVSLIKMLGLVSQEIGRIHQANDNVLGLELRKVKTVRTIEFVQGTLINAMRVSLIGLLAYLVYQKSITVGELMSLYFYSFFLFGQLSQIGTVVKTYQEALANHDQLNDIMSMQPENDTVHLPKLSHLHSIVFENISFGYGQRMDVLQNLSCEIRSGQVIGFVGPSGAGKSTLLKILSGLYKPNDGKIFYNEKNFFDIDMNDLKKKFGIVTQDPQLFSGTIRENLLFVQPTATEKDCREALSQASLDSFVLDLPAQLDERIGEGGLKLSGGQKQRLAIARALLRKPQLLIFDEATSSLDSLIEKEIADTITLISKKNPDLMIVLVAHRLSTVQRADMIYVLEKGTITESGKHSVLVSQQGLYAAMWREQT